MNFDYCVLTLNVLVNHDVCWMEFQTLCGFWSKDETKLKPQQNISVTLRFVTLGAFVILCSSFSKNDLLGSDVNVTTIMNQSFI